MADPTQPTTPNRRRSDLPGSPTPGPPAHPASPTLAPVGRFEPVAAHARGGLGEVLIARDAELGRDVALKRIRLHHADDPSSRNRFLREAEITARLEHPGIVPVYGLVHDEHGRPHYAMRFIEGGSLDSAIIKLHADKRSPRQLFVSALRPLLSRFVAMCNTIAYAHSRNVIHRDLKPANVMLGAFGETLVVDWGLAKVIDLTAVESTRSATLATSTTPTGTLDGEAVGTPAFMPPEQAIGDWERVGFAADIYSLGATLYTMLTGSPPFSGTTAVDILSHVVAGDLRPARQVDGRIPAPLAAIAHRAMSPGIAQRYGSATELGHDVERWLADEPVLAYSDPVFTRLSRWARRHKVIVAGGVIVLLAAVVGLATWGEVQRQHALELAEEKSQTETRRQEAEANAETARQNARRAEEQGQVAKRTLIEVVHDFQSELADIPAARPIRERWLGRALERLESVTRDLVDKTEADHASIRALFDLGDIYLSAGNMGKAEKLGKWTGRAREVYGRAFTLANRRADAEPGDVQVRSDLAHAHDNLGDVRMQFGDVDAAREAYTAAFTLRERLARESPTDAKAQRDLGVSHHKLGDVRRQLGDLKAARTEFRASHAILARLAETEPLNADVQRDLCIIHNELGDVSQLLGDAKSARESYRQSLAIAQRLLAGSPASPQALRDVSIAHANLADVNLELGDLDAAHKSALASLTIAQRLAENDPDNGETQADLSISHDRVGDVNTRRGDHRSAREAYADSLAIRKRLAEDSTNADAQRDLAIAYNNLGTVSLRLGDVKTARDSSTASLAITRQRADADPADAEARTDLVVSHAKCGDVQQHQGEFADAARSFAAGVQVLQGLFEAGKRRDQPELRDWLTELKERQSLCETASEATKTLDGCLKQPKELRSPMLGLRLRYLAARKADAGDIAATAEALRKQSPGDAETLYSVARGYALAAGLAKVDTVDEYGKKAVATLREAVRLGVDETPDADGDFMAVWGRDDFRKLIAEQKEK